MSKKDLGEFLVKAGVVDPRELRVAESEKHRWGGSLSRALIELNLASESDLVPLLGEFMSVPVVILAEHEIDDSVVKLLDEGFCRHNECMAYELGDGGRFLHVAMAAPNDLELYDQIRVQTQRNVRTFLAGPNDIQTALTRALRGEKELSTELQFALMNDKLLDLDEEVAREEPPDGSSARTIEIPLPLGAAAEPTPEADSEPEVPLPAARFAAQPQERPEAAELAAVRQQLQEFMRRTDQFLYTLAWHLTAQGLLPPGLVDGQVIPYPGGGRRGTKSSPSVAAGGRPRRRPSPTGAQRAVSQAASARPTPAPPAAQATPPQAAPRPAATGGQAAAPTAAPQRPVRRTQPAPKAEAPQRPARSEAPEAEVDVDVDVDIDLDIQEAVERLEPGPRQAPKADGRSSSPDLAAERPVEAKPGPAAPPRQAPKADGRSSAPDLASEMQVAVEEAAKTDSGVRPADADSDADIVVDRPPPELRPRAAVSSKGAGSAVASGEIKEAPIADPSASSAVLLEMPDMVTDTVVAIDFGTTRSSVAMLVEKRVEVMRLPKVAVLQLPGGEWDMPSAVGFRRDGSVVLGQKARHMLATEPSCALMSPKRLLGRQHSDPHIQSFLAGMAVETSPGPDGEVMLHCRGRQLSVTEACAHILNLLKLVAQRNLKREVADVVLTTPVTFGESQHAALKQAAALAGLNVVAVVDEPVAAALSNRYDAQFRGLVAVYDFGGGTFDFTVVEVEADGVRVMGRGGDAWLGGDDIDDVLANAAANAFWHETGIELRNQATQWQQLRIAAEVAKRELSLRASTVLRLPEAALTAHGVYDLEFPITRAQFAELCREIIERSLQTCQQTLDRANVGVSDINAVYVSGGCSHIPAVQQALVQFFGKVPRAAVPPERAVLVGAALQRAFQISVDKGA